ncbi:MAG: transcriptional regulator, partial [Pyrinomonadaceae bacterium]
MDNTKHTETSAFYRFGTFVLDVPERRLWREDEAVQLVPKQFDLLLFFVANAGRVTKKNEILDAVWPDTFVEETTLARNVSWLRKLIEDDGGKRLIETVPKVGYRFTPEVRISDESETLVVEEQTVQYTRSEETITIDTDRAQNIVHVPATSSRSQRSYVTPIIVVMMVLVVGIGAAIGIVNLNKQSGSALSADGSGKRTEPSTIGSNPNDRPAIQIGSVVNLQNRYPNDGSYLDACGEVWNKPEFRQVPTETKFVSTHIESNRDNGSGSWE